MIAEATTGVQSKQDGATSPLRSDKSAALVVGEAHARYAEQAYRGNVFTLNSGEITYAAAFNKESAAGTVKLICGIFNPTGSNRNAVILNSIISVLEAAKQSGPFVYSVQQCPAVTSSETGTIRNVNIGSAVKSVMNAQNNVAIVRQDAATTNLTILGLVGGNTTGSALAATTATPETRDPVEGKIIVPPGTIFGINGWNTGETSKLVASLFWEEIPV